MIDKVDQKSEEYLKWKGESVPIEQPQEKPIESEQTIEEFPELQRKKIFFLDWFFGIKTHKGQMKMLYYLFSFLFYYFFCFIMVYYLEQISIIYLLLL